MDRGYIKLWRKSLHDGWIKNHAVWIFWTYCLMKATHKEYNAMIGAQIIPLLPGQFVFGLYKAAEETGLSVQQIRTSIKFLEKSENLTSKATNKYSIISIINWHIYQSQENENNNQINKPITNKQQTNNNIQEQKNKRTKETIFILPEKIKKETWDAYLEMRKAIKKPATEHAKKLIINKLLSMTDDPNAVLEQSIANSYQGVFPLKGGNNGTGTNQQANAGYFAIQKEYVPEPYERPTDDQVRRNIKRVEEIIGKLAG